MTEEQNEKRDVKLKASIKNEQKGLEQKLKELTTAKEENKKKCEGISNQSKDNPQIQRMVKVLENEGNRLSEGMEKLKTQISELKRKRKVMDPYFVSGEEKGDKNGDGSEKLKSEMKFRWKKVTDMNSGREMEQRRLQETLNSESEKWKEIEERLGKQFKRVKDRLAKCHERIVEDRHSIEDLLRDIGKKVSKDHQEFHEEIERQWMEKIQHFGRRTFKWEGITVSFHESDVVALLLLMLLSALCMYISVS